jgi:DNA mismatch repair ATPase MutS
MREFKSAVGWFDLRHNGLVHPLANVLLLWDVNCVLLLEKWQLRWGKGVRGWFLALGELEALASLGGLAHDEPDFAFPQLDEGPSFVAKGLGHPLIARAQRVANDVTLPGPGTALLVTGSNMSGKSTLLRAMGVAAVLANAGGPVCARELTTTRFAVRTSIRVRDSLDAGISHFYAELRKLDAAVSASAGTEPVFFLLDEILHGTNSRERQIGARWVLRELLARSALGAVSTHDTELCRLEPEVMHSVQQVHFRENVDGERMTFDYVLRPGPVMAGNALRLMRLVGLAVPLDD